MPTRLLHLPAHTPIQKNSLPPTAHEDLPAAPTYSSSPSSCTHSVTKGHAVASYPRPPISHMPLRTLRRNGSLPLHSLRLHRLHRPHRHQLLLASYILPRHAGHPKQHPHQPHNDERDEANKQQTRDGPGMKEVRHDFGVLVPEVLSSIDIRMEGMVEGCVEGCIEDIFEKRVHGYVERCQAEEHLQCHCCSW
jgi:hypothetical protein